MARFSYQAIDQTGATVSGVERGDSIGAVNLALRSRGFQPLQVEPKKSILQFEVTRKKVPARDLMHFSRQLSVFIAAGIPILEALEIIATETSNNVFRRVLLEMIEALRAGDTFSSAAAGHPEAFAPFYIGVLSSAELTGDLDVVLNQLSTYIERDVEARSKVTSALVYPSVVLLMSVVTVVVLAAFVLPRFKTFFESLHATLPFPTRILLAFTNDMTRFWVWVVGAVLLLILAGFSARRTARGKALFDSVLLRTPVLGELVRHAVLERICRVLASMFRAGVALPDAMTVTADATNNAVYRKALTTVREEMLEGEGLAAPLARTGLFPAAVRQMFRVGEETGTLDDQLQTAADYYDRELDHKIKRFTSLFEPAVIIFMGVVVGFVAVALISAMYGIYKQVSVA